MVKPKTKDRVGEANFTAADDETSLREQLKAHLNWCAYLGSASDDEDLETLAALLRRTARTMRGMAEAAERYSQE